MEILVGPMTSDTSLFSFLILSRSSFNDQTKLLHHPHHCHINLKYLLSTVLSWSWSMVKCNAQQSRKSTTWWQNQSQKENRKIWFWFQLKFGQLVKSFLTRRLEYIDGSSLWANLAKDSQESSFWEELPCQAEGGPGALDPAGAGKVEVVGQAGLQAGQGGAHQASLHLSNVWSVFSSTWERITRLSQKVLQKIPVMLVKESPPQVPLVSGRPSADPLSSGEAGWTNKTTDYPFLFWWV